MYPYFYRFRLLPCHLFFIFHFLWRGVPWCAVLSSSFWRVVRLGCRCGWVCGRVVWRWEAAVVSPSVVSFRLSYRVGGAMAFRLVFSVSYFSSRVGVILLRRFCQLGFPRRFVFSCRCCCLVRVRFVGRVVWRRVVEAWLLGVAWLLGGSVMSCRVAGIVGVVVAAVSSACLFFLLFLVSDEAEEAASSRPVFSVSYFSSRLFRLGVRLVGASCFFVL